MQEQWRKNINLQIDCSVSPPLFWVVMADFGYIV